MAMENIRSRLHVLYGDRANLSASDVDGTRYLTTLHFPARTEVV